MPKCLNFIICISLFLCGCTQKKHGYEGIKHVDEALEKAALSQELALKNADSIAFNFQFISTPHDKVMNLIETAEAYKGLDLEKSLEFLNKAYLLTKISPETYPDSLRVMLKIASIFNSERLMTKEAADIFSSINFKSLPKDLHTDYYTLGLQINNTLAENSFEKRLKEKYKRKAEEYGDSVLKLNPESFSIIADRLAENNEFREALDVMLNNPPTDTSKQGKSSYYEYIARLYKNLEVPDSQIYYLSLASANDLTLGFRNYKALTELAELMADHDIDRANRYIEQSLKDAKASHSFLRVMEVSPVYNNLTLSYREKQKRQKAAIIALSISLLVIIIGFGGGTVLLKRKNKILAEQGEQLKRATDKLEENQISLANLNALLEEEVRVKNYYIHSFMEICLSYLSKLENFRAKLGAIAASGDLKKVVKTINSSRYVNEETSEFYEKFDKAFLSLYPEFFPSLNSLLRPEARYPQTSYLSTDLRVYALIWLGINSSTEIARFLRCSDSTVFNYRTQMRNKAFVRSAFEYQFSNMAQNKSK